MVKVKDRSLRMSYGAVTDDNSEVLSFKSYLKKVVTPKFWGDDVVLTAIALEHKVSGQISPHNLL